eukprot:gene2227-2744_t
MISDYLGPTPTDKFLQRTLADYSEGDHDFEKDLIESYKNSVTEHLPKLKESLKNKDEKESILHSHDIKGSSSYIGAEAVRFVSGKMEAYCKANQLDDAEECLSELELEINDVFKRLDDYMASWEDGGGGGTTSGSSGSGGGGSDHEDEVVLNSKPTTEDKTSSTTTTTNNVLVVENNKNEVVYNDYSSGGGSSSSINNNNLNNNKQTDLTSTKEKPNERDTTHQKATEISTKEPLVVHHHDKK